MTGETDLKTLLSSMTPELLPGVHVFVTLAPDVAQPEGLEPVMVFRCRMVTLNIHSSLEAVGFLAAITTRLAAAEIDVNPVSAFYHDHLFVPADRAEEAMAILVELAEENRL
jgi:hypothetical protein